MAPELRAALAASSPARSPLASEPSDSQPSGPIQSPARNRPGAAGTAASLDLDAHAATKQRARQLAGYALREAIDADDAEYRARLAAEPAG